MGLSLQSKGSWGGRFLCTCPERLPLGPDPGLDQHINRIREIQPWFGGDYVALLQDGRQLRVSRSHREALLGPVF